MIFLDNLSASLLQLCDEFNLTYESASERCNISSRYFGDIARRKTTPSVSTLEKLCVGFERTPNELLLISDTDMQSMSRFRHPMPVCRIHYFRRPHGLDGFPVCPQCAITMEREYQRFCDRCGQSLDWHTYKDACLLNNTPLPPVP